jgi:hypothetical protein
MSRKKLSYLFQSAGKLSWVETGLKINAVLEECCENFLIFLHAKHCVSIDLTYYKHFFFSTCTASFVLKIIIIFIYLGDCTFQTSLTTADCLWNNVQGDDFDWIANSGGTASYLTGPSVDRKGSSTGL